MGESEGTMQSDRERKAERKAALKAEAKEKGIPYEELKRQKKEAKAKKKEKRRREDEGDDDDDDDDDNNKVGWETKVEAPPTSTRPAKRARGSEENEKMSENVDNVAVVARDAVETVKAWKKEHDITVFRHGPKTSDDSAETTAPFYEFEDAPFCDTIQRSLKSLGFKRPTPIQSMAWPFAVRNSDMISVAKTGSGKTCGFVLPTLHQHLKTRHLRNTVDNHRPYKSSSVLSVPVLLVLAPTRELACQILEETNKFARPLRLRAVCLYGGAPKNPQIATLRRGVDVVVATPGRLNDLLEANKVDLSTVRHLVLDEADRMLDMGFEPQIRSVVAKLPKDSRQTMLFSATWPKEIQRLAHDFLKPDAVQINVGEVDSLVANKDITQIVHVVAEADKSSKLDEVLKDLFSPSPSEKTYDKTNHPKVIVFVSRKSSCNDLANKLWSDDYAADSLHGDRAQWERTRVTNDFRAGRTRVLVATDVAARGLDVADVEVVINYDMPCGTNGAEDYVHRIGRTGRAGRKGTAVSFFTDADTKRARELVDLLDGAGQEVPDALRAKVPRGRRGYGHGGKGGRGGGRGWGWGGRGRGRGNYGRGTGGGDYWAGRGRGGRGRGWGGGGDGRGGGRGRGY